MLFDDYLHRHHNVLNREWAEDDRVLENLQLTPQRLEKHPSLAKALTLTTTVVKEVLRFRPPASSVRVGLQGSMIIRNSAGRQHLAEELAVWPVPYDLHRHQHPDDPETFNQDRWSKAPAPALQSFSKCMRRCPAQSVAMTGLDVGFSFCTGCKEG